jgi:hypothetical protein
MPNPAKMIKAALEHGYGNERQHALGTTVTHPLDHELVVYKKGNAQHTQPGHDPDRHECMYGRCSHVTQVASPIELGKLLKRLHTEANEQRARTAKQLVDEVLAGQPASEVL